MELCPVLQSPHMKRERLEVHLHEKRLSSCVCGGGGCMGYGVIVGEFFPLNMFVLSFHNEQTLLEDKFVSSVAGDPLPPPALVRPAGSRESLSPCLKADAGPSVPRRRAGLSPLPHPPTPAPVTPGPGEGQLPEQRGRLTPPIRASDLFLRRPPQGAAPHSVPLAPEVLRNCANSDTHTHTHTHAHTHTHIRTHTRNLTFSSPP